MFRKFLLPLYTAYRLPLAITRAIFYVSVPVIVLTLPMDYFDGKDASICLSVTIFDIECYACGMTSAMMHIAHFDFETAFAYNGLSLLVFPILSLIWLKWFLDEVKLIRKILTKNKTEQIPKTTENVVN
jgi:hypothetical protein